MQRLRIALVQMEWSDMVGKIVGEHAVFWTYRPPVFSPFHFLSVKMKVNEKVVGKMNERKGEVK